MPAATPGNRSAKKVRTRFAPSPTGMLHIGGVRTALFNWLYAHHMQGEFLVRIEDTDRERSTPEATRAIIEALDWLALGPDGGNYVYQAAREEEHKQAVAKLLENGHAYYCYYSPAELDEFRAHAKEQGKKFVFREDVYAPTPEVSLQHREENRKPVVRLRVPRHEKEISWEDAVQGKITYRLDEIEDLVIQRSDGTPTYNLAVVADDAAMEITHVIRGDDHINNTPKQILLYRALGLEAPVFAHVPLIHGSDGKKLSKRHGAVSATEFYTQGYLPEALLNYLLRLGWAHGDEEIISRERAVEIFELKGINKGAAVFDYAKLDWLNAHYLKTLPVEELLEHLTPFLEGMGHEVTEEGRRRLLAGLGELVVRAKRLPDLAAGAGFYLRDAPFPLDDKAEKILSGEGQKNLKTVTGLFRAQSEWNATTLHDAVAAHCEAAGEKFGTLAQPVRAALTGTSVSPSVFHIMEVLGREESLARLEAALAVEPPVQECAS